MRYSLLIAMTCAACGTSQERAEVPRAITFAGGDGSDCATAVRILGAPNEQEGVHAEYAWLDEHHPGYQLVRQALIQCQNRPADRLTIATPDGSKKDVHFDISDYFGKF